MDNKPLADKTIVVTRAREQAADMIDQLTGLGANVIEFPVIKIVDPLDFGPLDRAVMNLTDFDWVIFTSANAVDYFWRRLGLVGKDATAFTFTNLKVGAVGPATALTLENYGLKPDFVPHKAVAEGILADLGEVSGQRFLLPQAELARDTLVEGLTARKALVTQVAAYRTVAAPDSLGPDSMTATELAHRLQNGGIELITFTSSSTVNNFASRLATATDIPLPSLTAQTLVACIGPVTATTARELGLTVGLEATRFTVEGLLEAITEHFRTQPAYH